MILHYLKKTVHNLFAIATNTQEGVLWKKPSETLNKVLEKYLRKISVFNKIARSENEFIFMYFSIILLKFWVTLFMTFEKTLSANQNSVSQSVIYILILKHKK